MVDSVAGLAVVVAVILTALGISYLSRRTSTYHPLLDVTDLGLPPGLVVFTSTDCSRCKEALAVARSVDAPLREVTYELESELQERAGVTGVPLTLVIDLSGRSVAQFAGRLHPRNLRRAVGRAGF